MSWSGRDHHPPCPCGKELADECMCGRSPLGSMRITRWDPNPFVAARGDATQPRREGLQS